MGYSNSLPYQQLNLYSRVRASLQIQNGASDYGIYQVTTPPYTGSLSYAYLDISWSGVRDDSGLLNGFQNMGNTTLYSGAERVSAWVNTDMGRCNASTYMPGIFTIPGYNNLAQYLQPSTTYDIKLYQVSAITDFLYLYGIYGQLRLYFGV